jgi:hypothetical protein
MNLLIAVWLHTGFCCSVACSLASAFFMNITDRALVSLPGLCRRFSPLLRFVFLFGIIAADSCVSYSALWTPEQPNDLEHVAGS